MKRSAMMGGEPCAMPVLKMAGESRSYTSSNGARTLKVSQCNITSAANRVQVSYRGPGLGDALFR
jgi:hypothetical protein